MKPVSILNACLWCLAGAAGVASLGLGFYAMCINDSGHTGFEPWRLLWLHATAFLLGITGMIGRSCHKAGMVAMIAGGLGMVLLFVLDRFNLLLQYDRWLERGLL